MRVLPRLHLQIDLLVAIHQRQSVQPASLTALAQRRHFSVNETDAFEFLLAVREDKGVDKIEKNTLPFLPAEDELEQRIEDSPDLSPFYFLDNLPLVPGQLPRIPFLPRQCLNPFPLYVQL
jgi:hypothetical protein